MQYKLNMQQWTFHALYKLPVGVNDKITNCDSAVEGNEFKENEINNIVCCLNVK